MDNFEFELHFGATICGMNKTSKGRNKKGPLQANTLRRLSHLIPPLMFSANGSLLN
jgi:hypothetical protein